MDDNKLRFGVGVLVIAAIGIGIILTFLFGAFPSVLTSEYTLLVAFPSADGIATNTPVLFRGVEVGRVVDVDLRDAEHLHRVTTALEAESNVSSIARHRNPGLVGVGAGAARREG